MYAIASSQLARLFLCKGDFQGDKHRDEDDAVEICTEELHRECWKPLQQAIWPYEKHYSISAVDEVVETSPIAQLVNHYPRPMVMLVDDTFREELRRWAVILDALTNRFVPLSYLLRMLRSLVCDRSLIYGTAYGYNKKSQHECCNTSSETIVRYVYTWQAR